MGEDEAARIRLWTVKTRRGRTGGFVEIPHRPARCVTEDLNRRWYEVNSGQVVTDVQNTFGIRVFPGWRPRLMGEWDSSGAVFEAKFMLPWYFSEETALRMRPQLQHNMWVVARARRCCRSSPAAASGGVTTMPIRCTSPDRDS